MSIQCVGRADVTTTACHPKATEATMMSTPWEKKKVSLGDSLPPAPRRVVTIVPVLLTSVSAETARFFHVQLYRLVKYPDFLNSNENNPDGITSIN